MQKTTIEVLPRSVIEKIAAGEVVERPAAVLKEIVENSIDAGATEVNIHIEDAGFSLIKVTDNGYGMTPDDLPRSMMRHATSKIKVADDLFSIGTFGFRGEALGSIAAVSRMTICSSADESGLGFQLKNEGGIDDSAGAAPCPHRRGTTISVQDLFFNVPARKKFMKTKRAEHLAIVRMLEQLVIPFPMVHFTLLIDQKRVFDLPAVSGCLERIAGIAGPQFASSLIECRNEQDDMEVTVYVSSPEHLKERPRFQSLYVNLRRINNDSVQYSVREAFSQFLGHNHRPAFFCFLTIDASRIDVNVHPTKQLIKFDNERSVFSFVFNAVKRGIGNVMVHSDAFEYPPEEIPDDPENSIPAIEKHGHPPLRTERSGADHLYQSSVNEPVSVAEAVDDSDVPEDNGVGIQTILSFPKGHRIDKVIDSSEDNTVELSDEEPEKMWDLIPCYQIHTMFVLAPIKNGILLIDQHAAHERILFEQALAGEQGVQTPSQQLLFPIVIELTPAEKDVVTSGREYFIRFGFEIEDFGGQAISISAIPAFVRDGMVEETIREMVRYLMSGESPDGFREPQKRFAAAFACGAAIKSGQKLTQEEMNTLLNNLFASENPYICPHGRPTLIRMSLDELSRRFLR